MSLSQLEDLGLCPHEAIPALLYFRKMISWQLFQVDAAVAGSTTFPTANWKESQRVNNVKLSITLWIIMAYLLSAQHFPQSFIGFRFVTCHSGIDGVCFHGVSTLPYFPFNPSPPLLLLFIETWLIAKYLKFLSLCLNVIRATPAKPSIPPPPASCNVWQGLKCYRCVSWLSVGVRLPFVLDQPAALHGSNRKAVLPLVLGALNYLVELA